MWSCSFQTGSVASIDPGFDEITFDGISAVLKLYDFLEVPLSTGAENAIPATTTRPRTVKPMSKNFEDACRKGNSSLHGTGENPGFWFEQVALTLTGVCNDVENIQLDGYCDLGITTGSQKIMRNDITRERKSR